jgi:[ribosomal protein S5]-alanine N-acetyltransferase
MDVDVAMPRSADAGEFVAAVQASRAMHRPWLDPPDTPGRFAAYLERAARDDQAAFLIRHHLCGALVGFVNVNNIVRGGFQSGFLGYGAFASHAGQGFMTRGLRAVLGIVFGDLGLHRVEANIQPANRRSISLARRLGFEKEGLSPGYLMVDGEWRDHERWALRAETWAGRGAAGR